MCLEMHQKVVCLGLLDGNARTIEATRDGGLHVCLETHQKVVCLGLLDVKAQAITANKMGALAYIARSMVALLHIVQSAYMGSSFSLC